MELNNNQEIFFHYLMYLQEEVIITSYPIPIINEFLQTMIGNRQDVQIPIAVELAFKELTLTQEIDTLQYFLEWLEEKQ